MNNSSPPKFILKIFRRYCRPEYLEDLEGDLIERFEKKASESNLRSAKWGFTKDVIKLFRPGIIKSFKGIKGMNKVDILLNHLTLTCRSFIKNKTFNTINLMGLTIAFLVCLFSLQYIRYEYSYDSYHKNKDHIYRLVTDVKTPLGVKLESSSIPIGPEIATQFAEIQDYTRIFLDYLLVQSNEDNYQEENIAYAEESLFDIFSFSLIRGSKENVFNTPFNAVISETAALKYYGTTDCLGKELKLDGKTPAIITGVMKDIPDNSHFKVDILLSLSSLTEVWSPGIKTNWSAFGCYTYLLIAPNVKTEALTHKVAQLVNTKIDQDINYTINLEPLNDIYLYADPRGSRTGASSSGSINNIYIFLVISGLILFIAVFNFINISNSIYLYRAKEISMKKILGVSPLQLKTQYLLDTILFSLVCSLIAISLFIIFTPLINDLAGKSIIEDAHHHLSLYGFIIGVAIIVGIISGIFPAFILTGFRYDLLLKGSIKLGSRASFTKNGMVIAQFAISVILIIFTGVVTNQLTYIQNKNLGYDKRQKLIIDFHFDPRVNEKEEIIRHKLAGLAGVQSVSISSSIPGKPGRKSTTKLPTKSGEIIEMYTDAYYVDYEFINQYKFELLAGRDFEKNRPSDYRKSIILNETAIKELGFSSAKEALGLSFLQSGKWKGEVIGVVKDFHFNSLHEKISPLTLSVAKKYFTFMTLELDTDNIKSTVYEIENAWKSILPDLPMSYSFADQYYNELYKQEQQFKKLTFCFAVLAISLSLMGLLSIAILSTNNRVKEMGVRKVLGASSFQLMLTLSKNLLSLVIVAIIIGVPIAIMVSNGWLENFAYRFELNWWQIVPLLLAIFSLTVLTISYQIHRVASNNPAESLKIE